MIKVAIESVLVFLLAWNTWATIITIVDAVANKKSGRIYRVYACAILSAALYFVYNM